VRPGLNAVEQQPTSCTIQTTCNAYLEAKRIKVLPKTPVGEAIDYTFSTRSATRTR
jgi:hypothetical protein